MVSDGTSLGDRMKRYEAVTRAFLPRRTYTILRVDGRAFHTMLRHADKPYDSYVMDAMAEVAEALCKDIAGAQFAYTQSDECSVLITDFESVHTEPWFAGNVQKMVSSAAATASIAFTEYWNMSGRFDARVFTIPDPAEVINYFIWRQRDAVRNSIMMAGQFYFPHSHLQGKNGDQIQEMLHSHKCINWNDYSARAKRGQFTSRITGPESVTYTDKRSGEEHTTTAIRSHWVTEGAMHFTAVNLGLMLPQIEQMEI